MTPTKVLQLLTRKDKYKKIGTKNSVLIFLIFQCQLLKKITKSINYVYLCSIFSGMIDGSLSL
jgi:hypothetical protein